MLITFRRTGGFAGIQEELGTVNVDVLVGEAHRVFVDRLQELKRLAVTHSAMGADLYRYEITIEESDQPPETLIIIDDGDPEQPAMQALISLMESLNLVVF